MTRGLRRRHRILFIVLACALPIAFAIGLAGRKPAPRERELPARLAAPVSPR